MRSPAIFEGSKSQEFDNMIIPAILNLHFLWFLTKNNTFCQNRRILLFLRFCCDFDQSLRFCKIAVPANTVFSLLFFFQKRAERINSRETKKK